MKVEHLVFFVEEPSTERFLTGFLSRFLSEDQFRIHAYRGKSALEKNLERRLRGYARWIPKTWRIVILVDRDNEDCRTLKQRYEEIVRKAGLRSKFRSETNWVVATRIAIEELEAWYIGDWAALCDAYPRIPPNGDKRKKFRDPDAVTGGTWEALEQVLQKAGYFRGGLEKVELARAMASRIRPHQNRSRSFQEFWDLLSSIIPSIVDAPAQQTA